MVYADEADKLTISLVHSYNRSTVKDCWVCALFVRSFSVSRIIM